MKIGYARVSTIDQNLDMQLDALNKEGCEKVFSEHVSGVKERPELQKALSHLRSGDTLIVYKLDRIGRSLKDLIEIINNLTNYGVELVSIHDRIDTTSAAGKLMLHILCVLADYERELIRERTSTGLAAARARGKNGGRPKVLTEKQIKLARTLYDSRNMSIDDICNEVDCSKSTFYRNVVRVDISGETTKK